jgi:two-component system chemotaxis response regulator CheY
MNKDINILIVDDFSAMRQIIRNLLHELGFDNTAEADNGQTALPMLKTGDFDFLVTDWSMPGMDGLTLLKTVRADEQLGDLPVLMVTAEAKREQIVDAAEAGVNDRQAFHRGDAERQNGQDFSTGRNFVNHYIFLRLTFLENGR